MVTAYWLGIELLPGDWLEFYNEDHLPDGGIIVDAQIVEPCPECEGEKEKPDKFGVMQDCLYCHHSGSVERIDLVWLSGAVYCSVKEQYAAREYLRARYGDPGRKSIADYWEVDRGAES